MPLFRTEQARKQAPRTALFVFSRRSRSNKDSAVFAKPQTIFMHRLAARVATIAHKLTTTILHSVQQHAYHECTSMGYVYK